MAWIERSEEEETTPHSWPQQTNNNSGGLDNKQEMDMGPLYTFKSMLESQDNDHPNIIAAGSHHSGDISFSPSFNESADNTNNNNNTNNNQLLFQPVDSSASCSPTSASVFNNNLDQNQNHHQNQVNYFFPPTKSLIQTIPNNPFDGTFDLGCESGYLESALYKGGGGAGGGGVLFGGGGFSDLGPQIQMGTANFSPNLLQLHQENGGFGAYGFGDGSIMQGNLNALPFNNRAKVLKPLDDNSASIGAQPTLFQKRAALRKNLGNNNGGTNDLGSLNLGCKNINQISLKSPGSSVDKKRKAASCDDDLEDNVSFDRSNNTNNNNMYSYDSDDQALENSYSTINELEESSKNGNHKGKKKGPPAKNLMAERRRRKKLNDRLLMLRSVVPNISKVKLLNFFF